MGATLNKTQGRPVSRQNAESGSIRYKNSAASLTYMEYKLVTDENGKRKLVSPTEAAQLEAEQKVKALSESSKDSTLERSKKKRKTIESDSFKSIVQSEKETVYESVIGSSNDDEIVNDSVPTLQDLNLSKIPGTPKDEMVAEWLDDHAAQDEFKVPPPLPSVPPPPIPGTLKDEMVGEWMDDHVAEDEFEEPPLPPAPLPPSPPPLNTIPNLEWPENDKENQLPMPTEITHLVIPKIAIKPPEHPPPPPPSATSLDLPAEIRTKRSSANQKEKKEGFFHRAFSTKRQPKKVSRIQDVLDNDAGKEKPEKARKVSTPMFSTFFGNPDKNQHKKKSILLVRKESDEHVNIKDSFSVGDDFTDLRPLEVDPKHDDDDRRRNRKSLNPLQKSSSNDFPKSKSKRKSPKKNVSWSDSDLSKSKRKSQKINDRHVVKDDKFYGDLDEIKPDEESRKDRKSVLYIWKKKEKQKVMDETSSITSEKSDVSDKGKKEKFGFMKAKKPKAKKPIKKQKDQIEETDKQSDEGETSSITSEKSDVSDKGKKEKFGFMKAKKPKAKKPIKKPKDQMEETSSIISEKSDASVQRKKEKSPLQFNFMKSSPRKSKDKKQPQPKTDHVKETEKEKTAEETSSITSEKSNISDKRKKEKSHLQFSFMKPSAKKTKVNKVTKRAKETEKQKATDETSSITSERSAKSDQGKKERSPLQFSFMKPRRPKAEKQAKPKKVELRKDDGNKEIIGVRPKTSKELEKGSEAIVETKSEIVEQPKEIVKKPKDIAKQPKEVIKLIQVFGSTDFTRPNSDDECEQYSVRDISFSSQDELDEVTPKRNISIFSSKKKKKTKKQSKDPQKQRTEEKHIKPLLGPDGNFHDIEKIEEENPFKTEHKKEKNSKTNQKPKKSKNRKTNNDKSLSDDDDITKKETNFLSFAFGSKGSINRKTDKNKNLKTKPQDDTKQSEDSKKPENNVEEVNKRTSLFNFGSRNSLGKSKENKKSIEKQTVTEKKQKQNRKPDVMPRSSDKNKNKLLSIFGSRDGVAKSSDKPNGTDKPTFRSDGSDSSGISSENTKCPSPEIIKSDSGFELNSSSMSSTSSLDKGLNIKSPVGIWGPKRRNQAEKGSYSFVADEPELQDPDSIVLKGFKLLDHDGRTLLKSKDYGMMRPNSYHEITNKHEFSLRSFSIGNELNKMSDTESADHGSTDKTSVTKLTQDGTKKNKFNIFDLVRRSKDRVEDSEEGKIIGETAKDVSSGAVEGDGVVYAELDIVRGAAAEASKRRDNDPDKTEYAEIIHPNPIPNTPISKKEELRKSRENLADVGPDLTTTPDGKKEAAV